MKRFMILLLAVICGLMAIGCGEANYIQYPEHELIHSFISETAKGDNTYLVCHVRLQDRYITLNDVLKLAELFGETNYSKYGTVKVLFFGPGDYADPLAREGSVAEAVYGPGGALSHIGTSRKIGVGMVRMIATWEDAPSDEQFAQYNAMAQVMRDYRDLETEEIMAKCRALYDMTDEEIQELFNNVYLYMRPTIVSGYTDIDGENGADANTNTNGDK